MQFHEKKKMDLLDFTSFFAWTFLNFLACCALYWPEKLFSPQSQKKTDSIVWKVGYCIYPIVSTIAKKIFV